MTTLRWMIGMLALLLIGGVVYRPHHLRGEPVSSAFPPQRIVSLTLATDEMLLALAPPTRIVALTYLADDVRYSNVVAEAQSVPYRVRANAEQVLALRPDLVLVAAYTSAAVKALLGETGIRLIELQPYDSLARLRHNIQLVGQAIGEEERAYSLIADMDERLEAVRARVAHKTPLRVISYSAGGFAAGSGTIMHELITSSGGQNVAAEAGIRGTKKMSLETLVALNPAAILTSGERGQVGLRELLLADPALQAVEAIQRRAVYVLPRPYAVSVSHHIVKSAEVIARALHPEAFVSEEE